MTNQGDKLRLTNWVISSVLQTESTIFCKHCMLQLLLECLQGTQFAYLSHLFYSFICQTERHIK